MHISPERLAEIIHFADAFEVLADAGLIDKARVQELHGFALRPAGYKESLVNVPFLIVEAEILPGKDHSHFAQLVIIDIEDRKSIIRDSSRGIYEQIAVLCADIDTHVCHGVYVRKGLRYEEYPFTHPSTKQSTMTRTYYLDF